MPQTIAYIVALIAGNATYAGLIKAIVEIIIIAASYSYQQSQAAKLKRALAGINSLDQNRTLNIREPAGSRKMIYGTVRVGGTLVYISTSGTSKEYLHIIIAHAGHECNAMTDLYLNNELVPYDGSGNATGKYAGYVRVKNHLGSPTQTVDTDLQTDVGSSEWTNNHRLQGICYTYIRLKQNVDLFPAGIPNVSRLIAGKKVYDPRTSTTAYSSNAALCVRDYLTDTVLGLGASAAEIDDTATNTAANICDETVNLNPSGTELRYALHGVVDTATQPGGVLGDMLSAMSGTCPYIGGLFRIKAGAHTSSVQTLTIDDARGEISVATGDSLADAFNGVKGVYISNKLLWQAGDFPPYTNQTAAGSFTVGRRYTILTPGTTTWTAIGAANNNAGTTFTATGAGSGTGIADAYLGEDGGTRSWKDITLPFTISSSTAQRLAKIELERSRRDKTVTFKAKLTALNIQVGDVVGLTLARYGWTTKLFEVIDFQFACDANSGAGDPQLGIDLMLRETDSTAWSWSSSEEVIVTASPPTTTLVDQSSVATPAGLTLSSASFLQADGTNVPRLQVSWTTPTDAYVTQGGAVYIEYKKSSDVNWIVWNNAHNPLISTDYITDVVNNTNYDVRLRYENQFGVRGAYCGTVTAMVGAINVADVSLDPPGQLFGTSITINASCPTGSSTVRYTTDGTVPNASSPAFPGGGLTLTTTATLRCIAFTASDHSAETIQTYTLNATTSKVATPSIGFSPARFASNSSTSTCTITCATSGSTIQKQVNGGGYSAYSTPFSVNNGDVVDAYATKGGLTTSDVATLDYENNV